MPFLASWLLLFALTAAFREFGFHTTIKTIQSQFRHPARYAGGLKFSVITVCTDTARPFME